MLKSLVPRVLVSLNWISLSSAQWQDKSQRAELKYRKLHLNTRKKKKLFHFEGDQTLQQVAEKDFGVSIHGDTQNLMGEGPE